MVQYKKNGRTSELNGLLPQVPFYDFDYDEAKDYEEEQGESENISKNKMRVIMTKKKKSKSLSSLKKSDHQLKTPNSSRHDFMKKVKSYQQRRGSADTYYDVGVIKSTIPANENITANTTCDKKSSGSQKYISSSSNNNKNVYSCNSCERRERDKKRQQKLQFVKVAKNTGEQNSIRSTRRRERCRKHKSERSTVEKLEKGKMLDIEGDDDKRYSLSSPISSVSTTQEQQETAIKIHSLLRKQRRHGRSMTKRQLPSRSLNDRLIMEKNMEIPSSPFSNVASNTRRYQRRQRNNRLLTDGQSSSQSLDDTMMENEIQILSRSEGEGKRFITKNSRERNPEYSSIRSRSSSSTYGNTNAMNIQPLLRQKKSSAIASSLSSRKIQRGPAYQFSSAVSSRRSRNG